jgi:hypothetical protein
VTVGHKLAAFAAIVIAAVGIGAAVGAVVGPIDVGDDVPAQHEMSTHEDEP